MHPTTAERLVTNEYRFREVNDRLEGDLRDLTDPSELIAFVCECSSTGCHDTVGLVLGEYTAMRANERQFAVVPGHELLEIERVVRREDRYLVVEKLVSPGAS